MKQSRSDPPPGQPTAGGKPPARALFTAGVGVLAIAGISSVAIVLHAAPKGLPRVWALGFALLALPFLAVLFGSAFDRWPIPLWLGQTERRWFREAHPALRILLLVVTRLAMYSLFLLVAWALLHWVGLSAW